MTFLFRYIRTAPKLAVLALIYLFSFLIYGLYCLNTVSLVKINGPFYNRIIQGKDVISDILPPPEYLIESYVTVFETLHSEGKEITSNNLVKIQKLKSEYLSQHQFWISQLPEDDLKATLVDSSYLPALKYFEILEKEFIPAIQAGNKILGENILKNKLTPIYLEHRTWIDSVVHLAKIRNKKDESQAAITVKSRTFGQILIGVLLLLMLIILTAYILEQVAKEKLHPT